MYNHCDSAKYVAQSKSQEFCDPYSYTRIVAHCSDVTINNQRLSRACIVHLVIKRTNWSYVKAMSCSGSHLGITINIKKHKICKGPSND